MLTFSKKFAILQIVRGNEARDEPNKKMKTVTIKNEYDQSSSRITLPAPIWVGREEVGAGNFCTAIYVGPRSKRVVIESDSIWENPRTHGCYGTSYRIVEDPDVLARLAGNYRAVGEALEKAGILVPETL